MLGRKFVVVASLVALLALFAGPAARVSRAQPLYGNSYHIDGNLSTGICDLSDSSGGNDYYPSVPILANYDLYLLNGGWLNLSGYNLTVASLGDDLEQGTSTYGTGPYFTTNNIYNSGSSLSTLTVGGGGGLSSATYGGVIGGGTNPSLYWYGQSVDNLALVFTGPYSQTLSGTNNTYTGGTTIQNGALLNIAADSTLGNTSGTLSFTNNGTLQAGAPNISLDPNRSIVINSGATGTIDTNSYNMTIPSTITGQGALAKVGIGTLTLSGTNTYGGATLINGGVLSLGSSGAVPAGGIITFGGGTLQFTSNNTTDYSAQIKNSTGPVSIDTNGQPVTFGNTIDSSNTGGLTKIGAGTLVMAATNAYNGATVVSGGVLQLGAGVAALASTQSFTSDANSGIGTANTLYGSSNYDLALAFNQSDTYQGANLTINGVPFTDTGKAQSGSNGGITWSLNNWGSFDASGSFPGGFQPSSGQTNTLLNHFDYFGAANGTRDADRLGPHPRRFL